MKWLESIYYYFQGRYGKIDEFSKFLMLVGIILLACANIFSVSILAYLGIALGAYGLLRPTSKEIDNRQKELRKYQQIKQGLKNVWHQLAQYFSRLKPNRSKKADVHVKSKGKTIIHCPNCHQKLRVPTGKHLKVTCNNCKTSFQQRT